MLYPRSWIIRHHSHILDIFLILRSSCMNTCQLNYKRELNIASKQSFGFVFLHKWILQTNDSIYSAALVRCNPIWYKFHSFLKYFIYPKGRLNVITTIMQVSSKTQCRRWLRGRKESASSQSMNMKKPLTKDCCCMTVSWLSGHVIS